MGHHVAADSAVIKNPILLDGIFTYASSLLLFREKSRLLRLCPCKRGHNASAALPTFYECAFGAGASISYMKAMSEQSLLCSDFFYKKGLYQLPCHPFPHKILFCGGALSLIEGSPLEMFDSPRWNKRACSSFFAHVPLE